jgi:xanthine dehydrogenase YagS FAD-binding subunit
MKKFAYDRATRLQDALTMVAGDAGAHYLAGGTNLVDLMKDGVEAPTHLVDVRQLPFRDVRETADGGLVIGAMVSNSDLAAHPQVRRLFPALSQATLAGASGQIRNMATVGGNLLQRTRCAYFADPSEPCNKRDPGSGCAAFTGEHHNHAIFAWTQQCVATNPSDMAVALQAFDAVVHYETLEGAGEIPLSEFYLPVGETPHLETALPPGALITAVSLPGSAIAPGSRYRKVRERASYAFANVSIAAYLDVKDDLIRRVAIALGGVASGPWRATSAEAVLLGEPAAAERFRAAADAELFAAAPLPATAYKVTLAHNLIQTVLTELAAGGGGRPA